MRTIHLFVDFLILINLLWSKFVKRYHENPKKILIYDIQLYHNFYEYNAFKLHLFSIMYLNFIFIYLKVIIPISHSPHNLLYCYCTKLISLSSHVKLLFSKRPKPKQYITNETYLSLSILPSYILHLHGPRGTPERS